MIQMIKNAAGYVLAMVGMVIALYLFLVPLSEKVRNIALVKFNILPYLAALQLKFTWFSFLLLDFRKGFLILFLFCIGFFFFYQAHRNAREKMMKWGWIPLVPYFFFYYFLKGIILLLCLIEFSRGKRVKW